MFYTGCYGLWVFVSSLPLVVTGIRDMVCYDLKSMIEICMIDSVLQNADLDPQWIVIIIM